MIKKLLLALGLLGALAQAQLRFAILGDRTGGADPSVYERIWAQVAAEHPAFVINVGDTIEGYHDELAPAEWSQLHPLFHKYSAIPLYLIPGNHDIWSAASERLWKQQTGHSASYSFTFEE
ncbi:MAG: metallophosphoesterase, partial [Acidobacteriota bacterium]|nr:metallophosphoesterase [Acidobacteriota bacterium]